MQRSPPKSLNWWREADNILQHRPSIQWCRSWACNNKLLMGNNLVYLCNLAMLARQAWRLIQCLESLRARVLRAKYYPNNDILSAALVANMSYNWRSILKGLEIVKEGYIWRIGSGERARIWIDPWIPRDMSRMPLTGQGATYSHVFQNWSIRSHTHGMLILWGKHSSKQMYKKSEVLLCANNTTIS